MWLFGVLVAARQQAIRRLLSNCPQPLLAAVRMAVVAGFAATVVGLSLLRTTSRTADLAVGVATAYAIHLPILAFVAAAVIDRADRRWFPDPLHLGAAALIFVVVALVAWGFASCTEARTNQVRSALRLRRP